mgnify:CR=1 FL=1
MDVKVHWIIDGVAELDVETMEEAEQKVDSLLREVIADNPKLVELLGARAIQTVKSPLTRSIPFRSSIHG